MTRSRTDSGMARVISDSVKPGDPITLRVKELPLTPGRLARATLACKARERLLSSGASIGMYTPDAPTPAQLAAVRVVRARRGRKVLVSATRHGLAAGVRAVLQVRAECAR